MAIEQVPGSPFSYYLVAFDKYGQERTDDPDGGVLSTRLLADLAAQPVTDVFLIGHGWNGDIPAARAQFNRWIKAMADCPDDASSLRQIRPAFRPLLIGIHWPSLPFGDEELGPGDGAFGPSSMPTIEQLVDRFADRIADTPRARNAIASLVESALEDNEPAKLPVSAIDAYMILDSEAGLGADGEGAAPGADREAFEPQLAYDNARADAANAPASFGSFRLSGLLAPLGQLSFWQMKNRARAFGESGAHDLLRRIQAAAPNARIHLMGHSFGCIVMSATVAGRPGSEPLARPVDTLFLVQGALSLWSYSSHIAQADGIPGYFRSLIADQKVAGVTLATTSEYDTAVGRFYPLGAGCARQVSYAPGDLPKYGALGSFGIQGPDTGAVALDMLHANEAYSFRPGSAYNIDASAFIRHGTGASGAHSDIAHREVAHAFWQAILARG